MIERAYHPLNRTDAIDAYLNGAFTEKDLYTAFRDNNYNDATAKRMVEIQKVKFARRINNLTGVWSIKKTIKAYKDGTIDGLTADRLLEPLMVNVEQRQKVISDSDDEVKADGRAAVIKRVRRAFLTGAMDDIEARKKMTARRIPAVRQEDLIDRWIEERDGRYKEPVAAMVLKWVQFQVTTKEEARQRLLRLGYPSYDADRMIAVAVEQGTDRVASKVDATVTRRNKTLAGVRARQKASNLTITERQRELEAQAARIVEEQEALRLELIDRLSPK
jgi:hypothetical protein